LVFIVVGYRCFKMLSLLLTWAWKIPGLGKDRGRALVKFPGDLFGAAEIPAKAGTRGPRGRIGADLQKFITKQRSEDTKNARVVIWPISFSFSFSFLFLPRLQRRKEQEKDERERFAGFASSG
jgi:hypothetical protein